MDKQECKDILLAQKVDVIDKGCISLLESCIFTLKQHFRDREELEERDRECISLIRVAKGNIDFFKDKAEKKIATLKDEIITEYYLGLKSKVDQEITHISAVINSFDENADQEIAHADLYLNDLLSMSKSISDMKFPKLISCENYEVKHNCEILDAEIKHLRDYFNERWQEVHSSKLYLADLAIFGDDINSNEVSGVLKENEYVSSYEF